METEQWASNKQGLQGARLFQPSCGSICFSLLVFWLQFSLLLLLFFETNFPQERLDFFWLIVSFTKTVAAAGPVPLLWWTSLSQFFLTFGSDPFAHLQQMWKDTHFSSHVEWRQMIKLWHFFPGMGSWFVINPCIFLSPVFKWVSIPSNQQNCALKRWLRWQIVIPFFQLL